MISRCRGERYRNLLQTGPCHILSARIERATRQEDMLTAEENRLLTRTNRGTPAGEYFRRYWLPALFTIELAENDGPPIARSMCAAEIQPWSEPSSL
jgi:hypothetical protein